MPRADQPIAGGGPSGYHRGHRNSQASRVGDRSLGPLPTVRPRWVPFTRSTPIGPQPMGRSLSGPSRWGRPLSGLLVQRVLAVPAAELLHFDPLAVIDLVLRRDVVTALALLACQGDLDTLLVLCHGDSSCTLSPKPAKDSSDACPVL